MTLYIYSVATWFPVHAPCCNTFNSQHEKVRTYVAGVYLSKELAKAEALKLNLATPLGSKHSYWVARHKVRDGHDYNNEGSGI